MDLIEDGDAPVAAGLGDASDTAQPDVQRSTRKLKGTFLQEVRKKVKNELAVAEKVLEMKPLQIRGEMVAQIGEIFMTDHTESLHNTKDP